VAVAWFHQKKMGIEMDTSKRMNVKLFAAIVGGSAVVAMGALGAAIGQQSDGQDVAAGGATVGAVTSTTNAPAGPNEETPMKAVPGQNGVPPEPSGEVPNRIP
jgi:hypothetical protein